MRSLVLILIVFLVSCGSTQDAAVISADYDKVRSLLEDRNFIFEADYAMPMASQGMTAVAMTGLMRPGDNAARISLMGTGDHMWFKKDSIEADIPYYGERQLSASLDPANTGIKFDGIPERYTLEANDKEKSVSISFNISGEREAFTVSMTVFHNSSATVRVNSTHRTNISYQGKVKAMPEQEEKTASSDFVPLP